MESSGFLTELEVKKDLHGIGRDTITSKPNVMRLIFAKHLVLIFSTEDMLEINHCIKRYSKSLTNRPALGRARFKILRITDQK